MNAPLTDAEITQLIDEREQAVRAAAAQIIARARRRGQDCPPCNGNCARSDTCPARLRAMLAADAKRSMPSRGMEIAVFVIVLLATLLVTHARARGWL